MLNYERRFPGNGAVRLQQRIERDRHSLIGPSIPLKAFA
jgi:hypothetical protein